MTQEEFHEEHETILQHADALIRMCEQHAKTGGLDNSKIARVIHGHIKQKNYGEFLRATNWFYIGWVGIPQDVEEDDLRCYNTITNLIRYLCNGTYDQALKEIKQKEEQ